MSRFEIVLKVFAKTSCASIVSQSFQHDFSGVFSTFTEPKTLSHNFSFMFQHDYRLLLHSRQPAVPCRIADSQGSGSGNEPKTAGSPSGRTLETGIRQGEIRPLFGRQPWFFKCIMHIVWLEWNYMKNICTAKSLQTKNVSFFVFYNL